MREIQHARYLVPGIQYRYKAFASDDARSLTRAHGLDDGVLLSNSSYLSALNRATAREEEENAELFLL